jgi:ABC-type oligopeptide transport system substrate-binding subunit
VRFIDSKRAPAYLLTWVADTPDRDSYLGLLFHSRGANNLLHYGDAQVDRLLEQARGEMDPMARAALYARAEERIMAALVLIPLYSEANCVAVRAGLRGFNLDPFGHTDFSRVWWETPR